MSLFAGFASCRQIVTVHGWQAFWWALRRVLSSNIENKPILEYKIKIDIDTCFSLSRHEYIHIIFIYMKTEYNFDGKAGKSRAAGTIQRQKLRMIVVKRAARVQMHVMGSIQ